ncbi:MAG: AMP-binding protein [Lawsonella clevelandensis]
MTYRELLDDVCKAANYLTTLGLRTGDRAAIYLPGIPEAVIAMLACARLGIIHTVVFGGFSAPALRQRLIDSGARIVITSDGQFRSGKPLALKTIVDDALSTSAEDEDGELQVESVLVVKRTGQDTPMEDGRDFWWHDVVDPQSATHRYRPMPAEHPLFLLYTSGTTPVVDTWSQTETGSHAIRPLWRYKPLKAGSAQQPVDGIAVAIVDEQGEEVPNGEEGFLVITHPWPSMLRGVWGDEGRFYRAYFKQFANKGYYATGDRAKRDEDGDIWILGRADDVINVAGHRLSTAEIESVIGSAYDVAETAVIGVPDESKGEVVVAYVVVRGRSNHLLEGREDAEKLAADLMDSVSQEISPIAKPARIYFVGDLPRTRSGKIMRRVVRALETDKPLGGLSTLVDPGIVDRIRDERANRGAF